MSDPNTLEMHSNIIQFPTAHLNWSEKPTPTPAIPTPQVDEMELMAERLNSTSSYKSSFDWTPIRDLERRTAKKPIRGGIVFRSPFKLVNAHSTCQQCLYAFEVDTYGRGCVHNCVYCYAKEQLSRYAYWNNPYPVPVDINSIRETFYKVFETDKPSKWRKIMENRTPIRVGSMSDSFMAMDDKFKVTKEFLKILRHYNYPCIIFTRSDLIAKDDYLELLDPKLFSVQFSISSVNDKMNRIIEPGAPSAKRRLLAIEKLTRNNFWTTVRINPLFPIFPDGYFTDPQFQKTDVTPRLDFFDFDMVDQIADAGAQSLLAGFVRLSPHAIKQISAATNLNFQEFFDPRINQTSGDKRYSDKEIRHYYKKIKEKCMERSVQFTTCYIGNSESQFWRDQDLWSNKLDCCNAKNRVPAFKTDSREIPFAERLKASSSKDTKAVVSTLLHHPLGEMIEQSLILNPSQPLDL